MVFLKALGEGVFTKFNLAALSTAGVFVVLGITEPAESAQPDSFVPGDVIELNQAHVVVDEPAQLGAQQSVGITYVTTDDVPFTSWGEMITITRHGETMGTDEVDIIESDSFGAAARPNPGVPFRLEVLLPNEQGLELTLNDLTLRESSLDKAARWLDPVPAARMELT